MTHVTDLIIRIKNAALARRRTVLFPYSKMNKTVLTLLAKEGFLENVKEEGKKHLSAGLRYEERIPIITDCQIVSKPSLRKYIGTKNLTKQKGLGITVVSTSKGIMTEEEARKKKVGGEVLFRVW